MRAPGYAALSMGLFIVDSENVFLPGPPCVGKAHLLVGPGLYGSAPACRTVLSTGASLIATLVKTRDESRRDGRRKLLVQPRLLIVAEVGTLPINRNGVSLFFRLVSRRAVLVASTQGLLSGWGEVSGDRLIAAAISGRLLHHPTAVSVKGGSDRTEGEAQRRSPDARRRPGRGLQGRLALPAGRCQGSTPPRKT